MKCVYCGGDAYQKIFVGKNNRYDAVCDDCIRKLRSEKIQQQLETVHEPRDFSAWKKEDMSEAFWTHLALYWNRPNKRSLSIMQMAFLWACHDDHGLSNSFSHALKWCGIDLFKEKIREDLPEE